MNQYSMVVTVIFLGCMGAGTVAYASNNDSQATHSKTVVTKQVPNSPRHDSGKQLKGLENKSSTKNSYSYNTHIPDAKEHGKGDRAGGKGHRSDDFQYGGDVGHGDDTEKGKVVKTSVPEPGTWALFGTGLLSLALLVALRRRNVVSL